MAEIISICAQMRARQAEELIWACKLSKGDTLDKVCQVKELVDGFRFSLSKIAEGLPASERPSWLDKLTASTSGSSPCALFLLYLN
jgi:recombinational DNA repair protein RecR